MAARLAQSAEHETLNLRVVGSSPTQGSAIFCHLFLVTLAVGSFSLSLQVIFSSPVYFFTIDHRFIFTCTSVDFFCHLWPPGNFHFHFHSSTSVRDLQLEHEMELARLQGLHREEVEALKAAHSHSRCTPYTRKEGGGGHMYGRGGL